MAETLSVTEVARHFADYVSRVAYRGESFVLIKGGRPMAELRPLPSGRRLGDLPGLLAGLPRLDDADAFAEDIERARTELLAVEVRDPWQS